MACGHGHRDDTGSHAGANPRGVGHPPLGITAPSSDAEHPAYESDGFGSRQESLADA
jgi:hypothetical protein